MPRRAAARRAARSEEHTSELQSLAYLVCRLLLEKKKRNNSYAAERSGGRVLISSSFSSTSISVRMRASSRDFLISSALSRNDSRYVLCLTDSKLSSAASIDPNCCFFFNATATTEIYTLSPTRRSSD